MSDLTKLSEHLPTGFENPISDALWHAIKAFTGREQMRKWYALAKGDRRDTDMQHWRHEQDRLTQELLRHMQALNEDELSELIDHYGDALTSALEV
jgi:hypothetical protein